MFGCDESTTVFAVTACVAFGAIPIILAPTIFARPLPSP